MNQSLSQEEVEALLHGLDENTVAPSPDTAESPAIAHEQGALPYDLTNQDRTARSSMPALQIIHQRLARQLRASLSGTLRRVVDVNSLDIGMSKFGDFLTTLPMPTSLHVFRMLPLRGGALLVIESKIVFAFIDSLFGGTGITEVKFEGREFTSIESQMIKRIVKLIFAELEAAWEQIEPIQIELERSEVNPQFVAIVPSSDIVVTTPLEIEVDDARGKIILCIPYSTIEPIRSKLKTAFQFEHLESDQDWTARLMREIDTVKVEVSVELGTTDITVRTLLDLQPGDIICLDQDTDSELTMRVEGVPKFIGLPRVVNQSKALEITSQNLLPEE